MGGCGCGLISAHNSNIGSSCCTPGQIRRAVNRCRCGSGRQMILDDSNAAFTLGLAQRPILQQQQHRIQCMEAICAIAVAAETAPCMLVGMLREAACFS